MARLGRKWGGTIDLKIAKVSNEGFKVQPWVDGGRSHPHGPNELWRCMAITSSNVGNQGSRLEGELRISNT